jgi:hypothetical protein
LIVGDSSIVSRSGIRNYGLNFGLVKEDGKDEGHMNQSRGLNPTMTFKLVREEKGKGNDVLASTGDNKRE